MNYSKLECTGCNKKFNSIKSLEFHNKICIYNIYKNNNNRPIDKQLLNDVAKIINLFNLYDLNQYSIIEKNKLLNDIKISYILNNKNEYYIYIYKIVEQIALDELKYIDLINIISNIYFIHNNDILDIINCCKKSYTNIISR
jgi:hypothetical protein